MDRNKEVRKGKMPMIYETDPWLAPYRDAIDSRHQRILDAAADIAVDGSLSKGLNNHLYYGMHRTADGGWRCTGYAGLASHGGTVGLMLALWLYVRRTKVNLMRVLDNVAIATPATACCIRVGNLMNSEIVGKPTDSPLGFVFVQNHGETFARYPAQLFEAAAYLLIFLVGLWLYRRMRRRVGTGFFFGFCLLTIFAFRFAVEFLKEVQEPWELRMEALIGLNQGQVLSIPFIIIGLYCLVGGKYCLKLGEPTDENKKKTPL